MGSFVSIPEFPLDPGQIQDIATRGPMVMVHNDAFSRGRLTTDAIGTFTLRLNNIVVGSRYRVEVQSTGALVAEGTAAASPVNITNVPRYPDGNAGNDLRVKVRKGTAAPKYKPFETLATAQAGTVQVFIAQEADPIA